MVPRAPLYPEEPMEPKRSPVVEHSCVPDGLDAAAHEAQVIAA